MPTLNFECNSVFKFCQYIFLLAGYDSMFYVFWWFTQVNFQMTKNESTGWKVLKEPFDFSNFWVCTSSKFDFIVHF